MGKLHLKGNGEFSLGGAGELQQETSGRSAASLADYLIEINIFITEFEYSGEKQKC